MKKEYLKPDLEIISILSDEDILDIIDGSMGWGEIPDGEEWN